MVFTRRRQWVVLLIVATMVFVILNCSKEGGTLGRPKRVSRKVSVDRSSELLWKIERRWTIQKWVKCKKQKLERKAYHKSTTFIVKNLFMGTFSQHMGCAESITYTTMGDYGSLVNLPEVVERWRAPISYTVYTQTQDVNASLDAIQYYRKCLPGNQLIRAYVSFHIYFPVKHWTDTNQFDSIEKFDWPVNCQHYNRSKLLIKPDPGIFGTQDKPIFTSNVARNIAREAANTYFILPCDIQLYPSVGFVEQFLDMVHLNRSLVVTDPDQTPRVYPVPIFEIDEAERIPRNKVELFSALKRKRAKLMVGDNHRLNNWINMAANTSDELIIFETTLRENDYVAWEPVFVSDNNEPLFEESVPLEGEYNKRLQAYAMCLMGYEYYILHPAFLAHHPSNKKPENNIKLSKNAKQFSLYMTQKIEPTYTIVFGQNENCLI